MSSFIIVVIFLVILSVFNKYNAKARSKHMTIEKQYEDRFLKFELEYFEKINILKTKTKEDELNFEERKIKTAERLESLNNELTSLEMVKTKKEEEIASIENNGIPMNELANVLSTFYSTLENNFFNKEAMKFAEAIDVIVNKKKLPNKISSNTITFLESFDYDVQFLEKDFKKIKKNITSISMLELNLIDSNQAFEIFNRVIIKSKVEESTFKALEKLKCSEFSEFAISLFELFPIVEASRARKTVVYIYIATKSTIPLIKPIMYKYKDVDFVIKKDKSIIGGFVIEDQFYIIDLSYLKIMQNIQKKYQTKGTI